MAEESRTIAYICPHCRQSVIVQRTVFQLAAAPLEIPCPCGKSALRTELMGPRTRFEVPCVACGRTHAVECDTHDVLHRRALAFSCSATGLDCCYVGEEQAVYAAVRRLEGAVDKLHAEAGERSWMRSSCTKSSPSCGTSPSGAGYPAPAAAGSGA